MPAPPYIHPRYRLSTIQPFGTQLATAIAAWPQETRLDPLPGLSPYTHAARLRDAVQAYRLHRYPDLGIDDSAFRALDGQFMIRGPDDRGHIYFAHRTVAGRKPLGAIGSETTARHHSDLPTSQRLGGLAAIGPIADGLITANEIILLTKLVDRGIIQCPIIFHGELAHDLQDSLMSTFSNVGVAYDPDTNRTIIM